MSLKPFKNIGIGVAFSPNLKANLFEAARLAVFFNSKLFLIHVGEASTDKKTMLKLILKSFEKDNLNFEVVFKTGKGVDVILEAFAVLPEEIQEQVHLDIHGANLHLQEDSFQEKIADLLEKLEVIFNS